MDDDLPPTSGPRRRISFPADPTEDELARNWSLTVADFAEIGHCRGDDHRRRYALQLRMLRTYGRFLDDYRQAPLPVIICHASFNWPPCCSSTVPVAPRPSGNRR